MGSDGYFQEAATVTNPSNDVGSRQAGPRSQAIDRPVKGTSFKVAVTLPYLGEREGAEGKPKPYRRHGDGAFLPCPYREKAKPESDEEETTE
jgi:hypothetical protein